MTLRFRAGSGSTRPAILAGWLLATTFVAGCSDGLDVQKSLQITNVVTGFYDVGVVNGKNKLVPSISFQAKNVAGSTIRNVQLNAVFRVIGDQQELGSAFVRGITASGLQGGATTEKFVLRSTLGYTGEQPRGQMLQHKDFKDVQVEIFAKHGSDQWVKLAQYKTDRQLLTH